MAMLRNVLVCCTFVLVSPLYFHIGEAEKKCFVEEIPDETLVVGKIDEQIYIYFNKLYV